MTLSTYINFAQMCLRETSPCPASMKGLGIGQDTLPVLVGDTKSSISEIETEQHPKRIAPPLSPTALTVHAIWLKIELWVPMGVLFNVTIGFIQFLPLGRDMEGNVLNFGPVMRPVT
jgi:hypothetical protein